MSTRLEWAPLPRVHVSELSYERFLREFALPKRPCILVGASEGWAASERWGDLAYFRQADKVNQAQKVSLTTLKDPFHPEIEREKTVKLSTALDQLASAAAASAAPEPEPESTVAGQGTSAVSSASTGANTLRYIKTWDYVRGGSGSLQEDFSVPSLFDRSPTTLSEQAVLGNSKTDMKWLYIGEAGTGSGTHIDTNNSSAWLWVARGRKRWRCVHGGDWHHFSEGQPQCDPMSGGRLNAILASEPNSERSAKLGEDMEGEGDDDSESDDFDEEDTQIELPDLFGADADDGRVLARFPQLRVVRLFEGVQEAGDICFNPTQCIHAVHNLEFTVSLTHNYIDASNLGDALRDLLNSWREDRAMVREMTKAERERFWSELFGRPKEQLPSAMLEVGELVGASAVEAAIEAAAQGDEEVAALLHCTLAPAVAEVRAELRGLVDEFLELLM